MLILDAGETWRMGSNGWQPFLSGMVECLIAWQGSPATCLQLFVGLPDFPQVLCFAQEAAKVEWLLQAGNRSDTLGEVAVLWVIQLVVDVVSKLQR